MNNTNVEVAKRNAAEMAVRDNLGDSRIVGIGSGSTVVYAVKELAKISKEKQRQLICIPTSLQAKELIIEYELMLGDFLQYPSIDVTFDGADEFDPNLNLIKGGGGCHVMEKIIAKASKKLIVIVDFTKRAEYLTEKWKKGIPIEVIQDARYFVLNQLITRAKTDIKGVTVRESVRKAGPVVSDHGNILMDIIVEGPGDPRIWEREFNEIPGVIDCGIFLNIAHKIYCGEKDGSVTELINPNL